MSNHWFTKVIIITLLFFSNCAKKENSFLTNEEKKAKVLDEVQIIQIPLAGDVSIRKSEISGLCWYNDNLILLPQYPDRFPDKNGGKIFYISKEKIKAYLSGKNISALEAEYFSINVNDFPDLFSIGSGFESVTINNNIAYFTIESASNLKTETYLISGLIDPVGKTIQLNQESLRKVQSEINIKNFSDESILLYNDKLYPIYEANGSNINPNSSVAVFDISMNYLNEIKFPNIEYRITDVTSVDENNKFWAINYFFPREAGKLSPANDNIANKFGIGKSHLDSKVVERLIQLQISNDEITLTEEAPIYIKLLKDDSRNWEGIARLDEDGFLIVTDMFPETILAFVKN